MALHPFIKYMRIIGKGRHGSRPLTRPEAKDALGMVLDGTAMPEQISAFFVLIRVREETPEEAAGFVDAIRERLPAFAQGSSATIDWGSYAGKRRHPPWFLLAIKALAQQGEKILLHGIIGPSSNRLYTADAVDSLGIARATSLDDAQQQLQQQNVCYLALEDYYPPLRKLLHLQEVIGLRTPLHSVARMLNPLNAPLSVHGVFHRKFDEIHQQTAAVLEDYNVLSFRGEGGEAEIRPEVDTALCLSRSGKMSVLNQPAISERAVAEANTDLELLQAIWAGDAENSYGEHSIIATIAAVKQSLLQAGEGAADALPEDALEWARACWQNRH